MMYWVLTALPAVAKGVGPTLRDLSSRPPREMTNAAQRAAFLLLLLVADELNE